MNRKLKQSLQIKNKSNNFNNCFNLSLMNLIEGPLEVFVFAIQEKVKAALNQSKIHKMLMWRQQPQLSLLSRQHNNEFKFDSSEDSESFA